MKRIWITCLGLIAALKLHSQEPYKPGSAEIFHAIQKAQVLGSVLYVAAHPDDENTRLISYFANERHYHTTYLSLTRGDGGQNLIGTEISELLGVIRTQELLKARSTDGGQQLFSRAVDFGYSKHPDETLQVWDKDEIMADVVWAIRKTQPDIIVHRFDHRTPGRTHGHHTASAMLSYDAFTMTADPDVYPEQLKYVQPWQPKRQFFNTSWFFYGSREAFEEADKSNMVSVDVGVYYPTLGQSNTEIAASSRSFHKSQGFGATGTRGSDMEYLELVQGDHITPDDDPFKGINTSWNRIAGGAPVGKLLEQIEDNYDLADPSASVPELVKVYRLINTLPDDGFWIPKKKAEIRKIIAWCSGLFVEAIANDYSAAPGQHLSVDIEAINRSNADIKLVSLKMTPESWDTTMAQDLEDNEAVEMEISYRLPEKIPFSSPYWLKEPGSAGMYKVGDQAYIGLPEDPAPISMVYEVEIEGELLEYRTPLIYKYNDPVDGEVYRPFVVSPEVFVNFTEDLQVFGTQQARAMQMTIKAGADSLNGTLTLEAPPGWEIQPASFDVFLEYKNQELLVDFTLTPPLAAGEGKLLAKFISGVGHGQSSGSSVTYIDYDHIPIQTILKPASVRVVKLDLRKAGDKIGYIMGAGDKIPDFLEQIGYEVSLLEEADLTIENLRNFDAVITGVRAYNTNDRLRFYQDNLFEYVKGGGTMIVQYNTNRRLEIDQIAPYPLNVSRDRVTVEEAEVRILAQDHPVIQGPNPITAADFDGWVQERGLYFPDEWDEKFTAILSSNDPGEPARDGGLLVAPYGEGWYIYTGYSWFRELPAGVPGAFRLFTNLISIGKSERP